MSNLVLEERQLLDVRELSARLGSNPLLTQASSGNISVKADDSLWIKASGKWLRHAAADDFLIEVGLARARNCVREDAAIPETRALAPSGSSASIETAMHAILPQKVVIHLHSVNAIAWAVREDAPEELGKRLGSLGWAWIPYVASGNPLARSIASRMRSFRQADVLLLGNHGLVICGDTCEEAERLLEEVERRLEIRPRPAPQMGSEQVKGSQGADWFFPQQAEIQMLARDERCREILAGGVLYPCQAIFLPGSFPAEAGGIPSAQAEQAAVLQLVEGQGVLCSRSMTAAEQQTLLGLSGVVRRIPEATRLRYLTPCEVEGVLDREASHYRTAASLSC